VVDASVKYQVKVKPHRSRAVEDDESALNSEPRSLRVVDENAQDL
jgi:hypothetical protein